MPKIDLEKQLRQTVKVAEEAPRLAVNTTELAKMLGISRPFCYELLRREDFPKSFQIGSKRLHSVDAVREWVAKQIED